jgi:hypothetical protein
VVDRGRKIEERFTRERERERDVSAEERVTRERERDVSIPSLSLHHCLPCLNPFTLSSPLLPQES